MEQDPSGVSKSRVSPLFKCKEVPNVINKWSRGAGLGTAGQEGGQEGKGVVQLRAGGELTQSGVCHGPQVSSAAPLRDNCGRKAEVGVL